VGECNNLGSDKIELLGDGERERQWVTKNAAKNVNMRSSFFILPNYKPIFVQNTKYWFVFVLFSRFFFQWWATIRQKKSIIFFFLTKVIGVLLFYPQIS